MKKLAFVLVFSLIIFLYCNLVVIGLGLSDTYYFVFPSEAPQFFEEGTVIVEDETPLAGEPQKTEFPIKGLLGILAASGIIEGIIAIDRKNSDENY